MHVWLLMICRCAGKDIDFNRWKLYGKTNPIYDVELGERGNPYRDLREDVVGGRASNALSFWLTTIGTYEDFSSNFQSGHYGGGTISDTIMYRKERVKTN